jgi:hypothetical protein
MTDPFVVESIVELPTGATGYASGPRFSLPKLADVVFANKDVSGVSLFAYMWRRFGPPWRGGDADKELGAWFLSTRIEGLFLGVRPVADPIRYCFSIVHGPELENLFPNDEWEDNETVRECRAELIYAMRDLLHPVYVLDIPINALGAMHTQAWRSVEVSYEHSKYAGFGMAKYKPLLDKMIEEQEDENSVESAPVSCVVVEFSGGGGKDVSFGPFPWVKFVGEHLTVPPYDYGLLGIDADDNEEYAENTLASAAQSGEWWVRPSSRLFSSVRVLPGYTRAK